MDINKLADTVSNAADNLTTTDEEERTLLQELHKADMASDSWLSKNIRPLFLVATVGGVILFSLLGSFGLKVPEETYSIFKIWGEIAIVFYFGSRGAQHIAKTKQKTAVVKARIERQESATSRKESRQDRKDRKLEARLERKANKQ
jgi:hypothetical protein